MDYEINIQNEMLHKREKYRYYSFRMKKKQTYHRIVSRIIQMSKLKLKLNSIRYEVNNRCSCKKIRSVRSQ